MGFPVSRYWFKSGEEWHAVMENSSIALCGDAIIRHNRDDTAPTPPSGAEVHEVCRKAVEKADKA